jgi:long-chain fatty acid transport protein
MRTLTIAAIFSVPAVAFAGGNGIPTESPRDLALSQAAVADQSGAEAVFLNTAALAGQDGINVSVGGELLFNQTEWSSGDASAKLSGTSTPPTASVAYGARLDNGMTWGAGAGMGVAGGGTLEWPTGWAGQEYIQSVKQQVFQFGVGGAFQPLPYLKLGASYLRYQTTEELHQSLNYLDHHGDAGIALSGGGNTFGVAAEVSVPDVPLTFGITYKHTADMTLTGDAHFVAVPPAFQTTLHDQGVHEKVTVPSELYIGAAYEVMPQLKIMAAYSFEHWTVYQSDTFIGDDGFMAVVPRRYNNSYVIRLGGEWEHTPFLPGLSLRIGVLRSMSSQPSDTVSPSLTDGESTAVSVGAGYNFNPDLRVDLGSQFAFFDKVTASGTEAFPGSYKTTVQLVSLGLNWRFGRPVSTGR